MSGARRLIAAGLACGACTTWLWPAEGGARTTEERLYGPLATGIGALQWTRAERALRLGELERGLAHAREALACTPRSGPLWAQYARMLALQLGSAEREADPARRRAWLAAGLAALEEGARDSDDPGGFALARALVLLAKSRTDPELAWPGGSNALESDAVLALEASRKAGNPIAAAMLERP